MAEIKAIPTEYNGYVFRSRTEAHWAVFFDALSIQYEYEPEGYKSSDGTKYLPDFYLPEINDGVFIEVKGLMDNDDYHKIETFWEEGERPLYILGSLPKQADLDDYDPYGYVERYEHCFEYAGGDRGWDWPYLFCVCPACGRIGIEFDGRGWRVCGYCHHKDVDISTKTYRDENGVLRRFACPEASWIGHEDKGYSWNHRRLVAAYKVARQAKFDHGLTPTRQEVQRRYAAEMEE